MKPVGDVRCTRNLVLNGVDEQRVGEQPRDLVLVLVGGELVELPRDGLADSRCGRSRAFGAPDPLGRS